MGRRLWRVCLLAVLPLLLAGTAHRAQKLGPADGGRLAAVLARMTEAQKGLRTLRVRFTQTNRFAMLSKPQVLKGTLTLRKPDTVLYAYTEPAPLYFRVKDGDLLVYKAQSREAFVQDIRRHEGRIAKYLGITQPLTELQKTLAVSLASEEGGLAVLEMTPLRARVREKVAALRFTVATADGTVRGFEIVEPGGDTLNFAFEDLEINPDLKDSDFDVPVPPGVTVKRQLMDLGGAFGN